MIVEAEERGDIQPGDTLIEATSGNTGIALAMVAAMKGYRMILVMPENQSLERRQTMGAFGAELVLTPKAGGMEAARDTAERMRDEGRGIILDQFANPDNPLAHYRGTGPEIWRDTGGADHALRLGDGHHRHHHGRVALPEGEEPGDRDRRCAAGGRRADPGHPQVAGGVPAEDLRPGAGRPDRERVAGGCRGHGPPARARGRASSAASRPAARARWRCGSRGKSSNATIVFIVCDRGDRYLSTGVFPG